MTEGVKLFHVNAAPTLQVQGRSGQSTLSNDLALQAPARSTRERGQRVLGLPSSSRWWLLLVGLIAAVLCLPFFRIVRLGDEGVWLSGAQRLIQGDALYVDFASILPPGSFLLTEAWFRLAGISIGSAHSLAILTIIGIACFTFLACQQAAKSAPLSAVLVTGWLVMSQGPWTQVNHHWFTTLFSMVAAWAALANVEHAQRWLRWPLIAGVAAGMAAMVTPHRGALTMLAAVTAFWNLRRHRAEFIAYVLGCALIPAALLAYVVKKEALAAAFYYVIRINAERYIPNFSVPFGTGNQFSLAQCLFPLVALLTLLVCAHDWRSCLRDRLLWSCAAFALAGFAGCFPSPDVTHIGMATPLVCPLLAHCTIRLTQWWRPAWWRYRYLAVVVAGVAIGYCALSTLYFLGLSQAALRWEIVSTPRGSVAFTGTQTGLPGLLTWIAATPSGDAYFFYPYLPMLSFLTTRVQVSKYDLFVPGATPGSAYRDACISVMRHASWVVVDRFQTDKDVLKRMFPSISDVKPLETKRFEQALDDAFDLVAQEGVFELRHRREGISDTICAGIAE